jgi:hypothetical protein
MFYFNGNILQSSFLCFFYIFFALYAKNKRTLRGSNAVCLLFCFIHAATNFIVLLFIVYVSGSRVVIWPTTLCRGEKKDALVPFNLQPHLHFCCRFYPCSKAPIRFVFSVCPSVFPSAYINSASTGQIFVEFCIRVFF